MPEQYGGGGAGVGHLLSSYGGVADCRLITDAAMSASSATLTSATAGFTSADVGKLVGVYGAGANNTPLAGTITAYTNSTTVTLSVAAANTVSGAFAGYGTDNLAAFNAALAAISAAGGGTLVVPEGSFAVSDTIQVMSDKTEVRGMGRGSTSVFLIRSIVNSGSDHPTFYFGNARTSTLGDRQTLRDLRCGVIPSQARSSHGSAIEVAGTNFLVDNVEVAVPGQSYSTPCLGIDVGTGSTTPAGPGIIRSCFVRNTIADGIFLANCDGVLVEGNQVWDTGDDAISLHSGNAGTTTPQTNTAVRGNNVKRAGGRGIVAIGGVNTVISGNLIDTTYGAAIALESETGYLAVNNCTVTGNHIFNGGTGTQPTYPVQTGAPVGPTGVIPCAFQVAGRIGQVTTDVVFSGNVCVGHRLAHVFCVPIQDNALVIQRVSITDNVFDGGYNGGMGSGQNLPPGVASYVVSPGLFFRYTSSVTVSGNQIFCAQNQGIYVESTCAGPVIISNNWMDSLGNSTSGVSAIQVAGGTCVISGNVVQDSASKVTNWLDGGGLAGVALGNQVAGKASLNAAGFTGAVPGQRLARTYDNTGGHSTSSTTFADIDGTNTAVTFIAPPSGSVDIYVEGNPNMASGVAYNWGVISATYASGVVQAAQIMFSGSPSGVTYHVRQYFFLTGLTPGQSYTFRAQHASGTNGQTCTTYGPILVEVFAN